MPWDLCYVGGERMLQGEGRKGWGCVWCMCHRGYDDPSEDVYEEEEEEDDNGEEQGEGGGRGRGER